MSTQNVFSVQKRTSAMYARDKSIQNHIALNYMHETCGMFICHFASVFVVFSFAICQLSACLHYFKWEISRKCSTLLSLAIRELFVGSASIHAAAVAIFIIHHLLVSIRPLIKITITAWMSTDYQQSGAIEMEGDINVCSDKTIKMLAAHWICIEL